MTGVWRPRETGLAAWSGTQYVHDLRSMSPVRARGGSDRCHVHAFSGWWVMGTRVSASLVRPLVVLGFLFGLQSPSLAQAPVPEPATPAEPDLVTEAAAQQAHPIGHVLPGRGLCGRRPARRRACHARCRQPPAATLDRCADVLREHGTAARRRRGRTSAHLCGQGVARRRVPDRRDARGRERRPFARDAYLQGHGRRRHATQQEVRPTPTQRRRGRTN